MKRIALLFLTLTALSIIIGCGNKEPIINSFQPASLKINAAIEEVIQFSANASDPDKNTTLTYSWAFTSGSPLSAKGASVAWTAPKSSGTAKATLTVSDGKKTVTKTWEITVKTALDMEVAVQLVKLADNTPYAVENMTVVLEDKYGMNVILKTDSNGRAAFPATERGTYKVVRVEGLDVTGGAEGATGLEFVKVSPLNTSAPKIAHVYSVCPTATLELGKDKVEIKCPIPTVRKVTILMKGSVDTADEVEPGDYFYVSESFAGRMIISNRNCDCGGGLYIRSSGSPANYMVFSLGAPTLNGSMTFYSGSTATFEIFNTGLLSDTLTLEVPGNGDWAFTSGGAVFTRANDGPNNDSSDSFTSFGRDSDKAIFNTYNFGHNTPPPNDRYRFNYEVQKFEEL